MRMSEKCNLFPAMLHGARSVLGRLWPSSWKKRRSAAPSSRAPLQMHGRRHVMERASAFQYIPMQAAVEAAVFEMPAKAGQTSGDLR